MVADGCRNVGSFRRMYQGFGEVVAGYMLLNILTQVPLETIFRLC